MRALVLAVPAAASAQTTLTLEELGALHPTRTCFTGNADLALAGFDPDGGAVNPAEYLEGRGGAGLYDVYDVGNVAFVGGPWTYGSLGFDAVYGSLNAFLGEHGNDYDFVSIFVTEHLNFGALYSGLQNDTSGIGLGFQDQTSDLGFSELEGFLFMNSIFDYTGSLHDALFFGQEVGHRWGSFVRRAGGGRDMLGRDDSHWSFFMDTDNSTMEGNNWESLASNRWRTSFDEEVGYSELDMYLMGFMDPDDVDPWLLIDNPTVVSNPYGWGQETGGIGPATTPYYVIQQYIDNGDDYPVVVSGNRIDVEIEDVISVHGPRSPDHTESQRDFNMAFIIIHPESEEVDFDDYLVIEDTREELAALWEEMVDDEAVMRTEIGGSTVYEINPDELPAGIAFEPAPGGQGVAAGCATSIAASAAPGAAALLALLPLVIRRRR